MAAGATTKFLVALLILINALVLYNIRRASPALPRAPDRTEVRLVRRKDKSEEGDVVPFAGAEPIASQDIVFPLPTKGNLTTTNTTNGGGDAVAFGVHEGAEGELSTGGGGTLVGTGDDQTPATVAGEKREGNGMPLVTKPASVGLTSSGEPAEIGSTPETITVEKAAEAGGDKGVVRLGGDSPKVSESTADGRRRSRLKEECRKMMKTFKIVPNTSWGAAGKQQREQWDSLGCNSAVPLGAGTDEEVHVRMDPIDCTASPSLPTDPLIGVCAGSTTRGVRYPDEESLALFRYLLPSLGLTADCGFNYLAVIGYDAGDTFFDSAAGVLQIQAWFESKVSGPAASRGIHMELELVRVDNHIRKPGPVFTATTKVAYERGANYIYRVNDDSEMMDPWARSFSDVLEAMGPPYGVVGPESLNANILVHDFTHRLHMDIFHGQYYPSSLTDWYVDDWISRVYGNARTVRAENCQVRHHTGAHGQRYTADRSKLSSVSGLVAAGARNISDWADSHGYEEAASQIRSKPLNGRSATRASARFIP